MSLAAFMAVAKASDALPDKFDLTGSDTHDATGNGAYASNGVYPGFSNTNGRVSVDPTINGGIRNLIILVAGQSNACNISPTAYTATQTGAHCLNIYDGGVYKMKDPVFGSSNHAVTGNSPLGGTWMSRLSDKLIQGNVADRVIMVPCAMAGSWIGDWDPIVSPINNYQRIQVALRRCAALGYTPSAIVWHQGENDSGSGTAQATYTAILNRIITQSRTDGFTGPWFVNTVSYNNGVTSSAIQAAQAAVVSHPGVWAGANSDSLTSAGGYRQPDNGHLNDTGMDANASLMVTALHAYGAPF